MKKLKSFLCICIAIVFVISVFTFSHKVYSASAETTYWNDYAGTQALSSASGKYEIYTPQDLAYFNKYLGTYANANIILKNNINLSNYSHLWQPNTSTRFKGCFDGNEFKIIGLKSDGGSTCGLFGTLDYGAKVQNLTIESASLSNVVATANGIARAGIICGYLEGLNGTADYNIFNCKILNCTITYKGLQKLTPSNPSGPIEKLSSLTNIKPLAVDKSDYNTTVHAGGIAGFAYTASIKNCYISNLTIQQTSVLSPTNSYVGGVVGKSANTQIYVTCVENNSNINSKGSVNSYAGGIAGQMYQENNNTTSASLITKCYTSNSTITAGNTLAIYSYAGGITGALSYGKIENCFNNSTITAKAKQNASTSNLTDFSFNIENFVDYKGTGQLNIASGNRTGKVSGSSSADKYLSPINSTKTITTSNSCSGGIAGTTNSGTTISYCYNRGTITKDTETLSNLTTYTFYFKMYKYNGAANPKENYYFAPIEATASLNGIHNVGSIVGKHSGSANNYYNTQNISYDSPTKNDSARQAFYDGYNNKKWGPTISISTTTITFSFYYYVGTSTTGYGKKTTTYTHSGHPTSPHLSNANSSLVNTIVSDYDKNVSSTNNPWFLKGSTPLLKDFYWEYNTTKPG